MKALRLLALVPFIAAACSVEGPGEQHDALSDEYVVIFTTEDGWLDMETEYLPRVCTQENGAADYAALEAQVIAARTYLLRAMRDDPQLGTEAKPVVNGESFQAYAATANPGCRQATEATTGVVATWQGELIVANYVAGALVRPDGSIGKDLTHTEHFVTYNEGKSGDDVTPAPKPIALPSRSDNRGCMGQNRADFLAEQGMGALEILRFFYGADMQLEGGGSSPAPPACVDLDPHGECHNGVLFFCFEDELSSVDCHAQGRSCVPGTSAEAAQCAQAIDPGSECGLITYEGHCEGDALSWCSDQNQLVVRDCGAEGLTCGAHKGGYDCVPPVEGSCSAGTLEPQCHGTYFVRCVGDEIGFIDCAELGKACGYYEDAVDCLQVVR